MPFTSVIFIPLTILAPPSSLGFTKRFLVFLGICEHPRIPNPAPGAGRFVAFVDRGQGPEAFVSTDSITWTLRGDTP